HAAIVERPPGAGTEYSVIEPANADTLALEYLYSCPSARFTTAVLGGADSACKKPRGSGLASPAESEPTSSPDTSPRPPGANTEASPIGRPSTEGFAARCHDRGYPTTTFATIAERIAGVWARPPRASW